MSLVIMMLIYVTIGGVTIVFMTLSGGANEDIVCCVGSSQTSRVP